MKRLILIFALALCLFTVPAHAYLWEVACGRAEEFGWNSVPQNNVCFVALLADIAGPGPDGMW